MRVSFLLLMLAALSGCRSQDSAAIADNCSGSGGRVVDLAAAVPGEWDRVCVLGPYSGVRLAFRDFDKRPSQRRCFSPRFCPWRGDGKVRGALAGFR